MAYLVCKRNGLDPESEKYLSQFLEDQPLPEIQVYQVMRAAGQIEQLFDLIVKTRFDKHHQKSAQLALEL